MILVQVRSAFAGGAQSDLEIRARRRPFRLDWRTDRQLEIRKQKTLSILDKLCGLGATIIAFPEYTVPFEVHENFQAYADRNNCILVPGSYYDDRVDSVLFRSNVCHIYVPNKPVLTIIKQEPTPDEEPLLEPGRPHANVARLLWNKSGERSVSVNIFLCRDYLKPFEEIALSSATSGTGSVSRVSQLDWDHEGLNLVVMDTSESSLFIGQAGLDVRRMRGLGKIVALCNAAGRGSAHGSAILAPASEELRKFGDVAESLPSSEEGILIVDTVLKDVFHATVRPDKEIHEPLRNKIDLQRIVTLDDEVSVNLAPSKREVHLVQRGVWHPAFLDVIGRELHLDLHVARNFTKARAIFEDEGISYVYAASVRGEHDIMIRRYASRASEPTDGPEPLPKPCSSLTPTQFWSLFDRDRKLKFVTEARDVFRYRTINIDPDPTAWEERRQRIEDMFTHFSSDVDRKRILTAIWRLSADWETPAVNMTDRRDVMPVFFDSCEQMLPIGADRGSGLRETYVLIAVLSQHPNHIEAFHDGIILGRLRDRKEIRSIYRVRSNQTRFNYLLDIIGTPADADGVIIDVRTWAEAKDIPLGTRSFDVMEYLQSRAVEGLAATHWSKHILPFIKAIEASDPEAAGRLNPDLLANTDEQLANCAEAWVAQVNQLKEAMSECREMVTEFWANLYLGNFYPEKLRSARSLRFAKAAWLNLYGALEDGALEFLEKRMRARGTELDAALKLHFEKRLKPDEWFKLRTDSFALVILLWEEERREDPDYRILLRQLRKNYNDIIQKGFRNKLTHGLRDTQILFNIRESNAIEQIEHIRQATEVLIGLVDRVADS